MGEEFGDEGGMEDELPDPEPDPEVAETAFISTSGLSSGAVIIPLLREGPEDDCDPGSTATRYAPVECERARLT